MATSSPSPPHLFPPPLMTNILLLHFQRMSRIWIVRTQGYFLLEYFWHSVPPPGTWGKRQSQTGCSRSRCTALLTTWWARGAVNHRQMPLTGFLLKLSVTVRWIPSPPLYPHLHYTTVLNKCPRKELELATNFSATHGLIVQIPLFREVHTEFFYLLFLEEIF